MKWLKTNWTTLAMALILSLVTVGLLTEPEKDRALSTQNVRFSPDIREDVRSEFGSIEFLLNDRKQTETIPVTMTGNEMEVLSAAQNLTCQPILDRSKFPSDDPTAREIRIKIEDKDFNLPPDLARRIRIQSFELTVKFSPMVKTKLPLDVSPSVIEDAKDSRYRVDAVRAVPPSIYVLLPVDKLSTLTSLPIRPIRIEGRTKSFQIEGALNRDLPELKDVRVRDIFYIDVELSLIQSKADMENVPLHLSAPVIPGHKVELVERFAVKVSIEGPEDLLKALREKPENLHVYVKLDSGKWTLGSNSLGIKCEVSEEFRKNQVRAYLAVGEPGTAQVQVTKN